VKSSVSYSITAAEAQGVVSATPESWNCVDCGANTAPGLKGRSRILEEIIPNPIDQNPWAHWRSPMDMMRQGWSTSLFHAAQQWSTRSS
jgi:hypothetical protein